MDSQKLEEKEIFPIHTDNKIVFLKPKFLQKLKFTIFPQRPNFSSKLAEKYCKELATLIFPPRWFPLWVEPCLRIAV